MQPLFEPFNDLRLALEEEIFDQPEAVDAVIQALLSAKLLPSSRSEGPRAVVTLIGPPLCGKLLLAQTLARRLEGYGQIKVFPMGDYAAALDGDSLCGTIDEEGEIARFVGRYPASVLVFDEIERADSDVQTRLAHLLSGHTPNDRMIDLSQTIVLMTSEAGDVLARNANVAKAWAEDRNTAEPFIIQLLAKEKKILNEQVQPLFSSGLLSFLSQYRIVWMRKLEWESFEKIVRRLIAQVASQMEKLAGIGMRLEEESTVGSLLLLSYAPFINAKRISTLPRLLVDRMLEAIRDAGTIPGAIVIGADAKAVSFVGGDGGPFRETAKTMIRKGEGITLVWHSRFDENVLRLTLGEPVTIRLPESSEQESGEPQLRYAREGFEAIAGQQAVKSALQEVIRLFAQPDLLARFDVGMPRGMILYGPAGVGKSLLARAFAYEAGLPYVRIEGGTLFDVDALRQAYAKAAQNAPAIVILDDLDAKGVINGVLSAVPSAPLLDQIAATASERTVGVFTVATARDLDEVPSSLRATDYLDLSVEVTELDREARKFFIGRILEKPNDGRIDADRVAAYITGMNGYELQRISRQAALAAIREGLDVMTEEILIDQINEIKYGKKIERKRIRNPETEREMTAYHEAGHAVLSRLLLPDIAIEQVTVAPRSEALGFVSYAADDFVNNATKAEILNNLSVLLAGREAKCAKFGPKGIDSGAMADLERATLEAYAAIAHLGMDDVLGPINIQSFVQVGSGDFMAGRIEERVIAWLADAQTRCRELVREHWPLIEAVARRLVDCEVIAGSELMALMESQSSQ